MTKNGNKLQEPMIITDHFRRKTLPLSSVLYALASQENNDGDEGNAMQAAADYIRETLQQPEDKWQPIETAPKDGTKIQGFYPNQRWLSNKIDCISWGRTMCTGEYGWFTENGCWIPEYKHPTHWKHLQELPEVK